MTADTLKMWLLSQGSKVKWYKIQSYTKGKLVIERR